MVGRIGIRREDKNEWERRAPLTPKHVQELVRNQGVQVVVEPAKTRVFTDAEYADAGAVLSEDLTGCSVILGVKEVPIERLLPSKPYVFFGHVIKGQPHNMPLLKRLIDMRCTLIDYELITNDKGMRIIFFGRYAGLAGTLDTLWALGQRFQVEGVETPLAKVRQAHRYASLDEAKRELERVGSDIRERGFPEEIAPIVVGFTGEGNVSTGAQEVFDWLPVEVVQPEKLQALMSEPPRVHHCLYKLLIPPPLTVQRISGEAFDWDHYVANPDQYRADMERWLVHLTALVNGIYWDARYPRLVTREWVERTWQPGKQPTLRVIGDISCDIEGSIEVTVRATNQDEPVFVFDPVEGKARTGFDGHGPVVMAVDNLPTELPVESSHVFADALLPFVPLLARCDWTKPYDQLVLPGEMLRGIIVHNGQLVPRWEHLAQHLPK